jgi:hypothetical protein
MYKISFVKAAALAGSLLFYLGAVAQGSDLRVVLIRHAEKPAKGSDLTCQGINRSRQLVPLLHSRFGLPSAIYVPDKGKGNTKRSRMYKTILPFASKYRLPLNTDFREDELPALAKNILQQRGVVLVVWEHSGLPEIARNLGVREDHLHWKDDDYDSMWIVGYVNGTAVLTKDKEGLKPGEACPVE